MTDDETTAEDLLQETFYQALLHIDRFEGRCQIYTWLCQIGKNLWLKELRRRKRMDPRPIEKAISQLIEPKQTETYVQGKEERERFREAVLHLPEPYREVTMLHIYGERQFTEIASIYGKSESWARVTFHRAKLKIKEALEDKT